MKSGTRYVRFCWVGSKKQLPEDLKFKLVNLRKVGEGFDNMSKHLGILVPNVKTIIENKNRRNVTKTLSSSGIPGKRSARET